MRPDYQCGGGDRGRKHRHGVHYDQGAGISRTDRAPAPRDLLGALKSRQRLRYGESTVARIFDPFFKHEVHRDSLGLAGGTGHYIMDMEEQLRSEHSGQRSTFFRNVFRRASIRRQRPKRRRNREPRTCGDDPVVDDEI